MQPSTSNSASTSNQPLLPTSLETASTLPAATRSTGPSLPNTAEQMLAKRKRKRAQEPNPLSQKKKKKEGGKAVKTSQEKGKAKAAVVGNEKEKEKKQKETVVKDKQPKEAASTSTVAADKPSDPTKGVPRPEGPGTSKKALRRKQQREKKEAVSKPSMEA